MNRMGKGAAAVLLVIVLALFPACAAKKDKGEPVIPENGVFRIDASGIGKGEVRFFRYETVGKGVVFFVARSPQGDIKTAFDACITCYPHKKGYRQEEDCVVCIFCDTPFRIEELEQGKGNCVPIRIEHTLDGNAVVIERPAIEAGAAWF
ncbi:MAG: DUF2318 domain-containing protein [Nitrospirae bacterium]|nr:DUF2318 domain-containing protein [Nitrospirota bacterium]